MQNTIDYYEELKYMDDFILPYYGENQEKKKKSVYVKNHEYEYDNEAIKEAVKHFKQADTNKHLPKTSRSSRYFYNVKSVRIFFEKVSEYNLSHTLGVRNIGTSDNPCFEINFEESLKIIKPEEY